MQYINNLITAYKFEDITRKNPFIFLKSKSSVLEAIMLKNHCHTFQPIKPSFNDDTFGDCSLIIPKIESPENKSHPKVIASAKTIQKSSNNSLKIFSDLEDMTEFMCHSLIDQLLHITSKFTLREIFEFHSTT